VLVNINTLAILSGRLPARALGMATEWASLHQQELRAAWGRAKQLLPPGQIDPLPGMPTPLACWGASGDQRGAEFGLSVGRLAAVLTLVREHDDEIRAAWQAHFGH
jgi:hypothetical protein